MIHPKHGSATKSCTFIKSGQDGFASCCCCASFDSGVADTVDGSSISLPFRIVSYTKIEKSLVKLHHVSNVFDC